ncbi:hypothetical protein PCAR4_140201 [Paraburkholderia caribensis]|nr:hypothetical protein PCAR4_140201 [Paraburkholderia caribensis]
MQGREFIPEGYAVRPLSERFHTVHNKRSVAESGYWIATYENGEKHFLVGSENPERYRDGEHLSGRGVAGSRTSQRGFIAVGTRSIPETGVL